MSDLIYRHDAIKAIKTSRFLVDAIEKVMMLPSAQPDACENACEIERKSNDCISRQAAIDEVQAIEHLATLRDGDVVVRMNDVEHILYTMPSVQPEPEDFEWCTDCKEYDQAQHCCHRWTKVIRKTVEELKAQPKTGKIYFEKENTELWGSNAVCRLCGCKWLIDDFSGDYNYCPNCGAKLLKEGEEYETN